MIHITQAPKSLLPDLTSWYEVKISKKQVEYFQGLKLSATSRDCLSLNVSGNSGIATGSTNSTNRFRRDSSESLLSDRDTARTDPPSSYNNSMRMKLAPLVIGEAVSTSEKIELRNKRLSALSRVELSPAGNGSPRGHPAMPTLSPIEVTRTPGSPSKRKAAADINSDPKTVHVDRESHKPTRTSSSSTATEIGHPRSLPLPSPSIDRHGSITAVNYQKGSQLDGIAMQRYNMRLSGSCHVCGAAVTLSSSSEVSVKEQSPSARSSRTKAVQHRFEAIDEELLTVWRTVTFEYLPILLPYLTLCLRRT